MDTSVVVEELVVVTVIELPVAAGLFALGRSLLTNRRNSARRLAAFYSGWRLDAPAEDQPQRLRRTFEQQSHAMRRLGYLSIAFAVAVVVIWVGQIIAFVSS